ncbi:hypothetical protein COB11_07945 [Candidatus Aerophobetes bacterium]|uniref:DUF3347 domain-containing protein n=1 Tax=Aerophobetes bacterium TaxID=2030807 RepID=A0A2A4YB58_UNCAE|nr:MAG: hypothetical protein COB11_07945 [Candidatus Aerophobetes bacterium]
MHLLQLHRRILHTPQATGLIFQVQDPNHILDLQDQFGNPSGETLYTAFCPMAFDFEGAKWIQRGTEINNPYFGDQMLRCGDIQETHEPINQPDHDGMDMNMDMDKTTPEDDKGHDHDNNSEKDCCNERVSTCSTNCCRNRKTTAYHR